MAFFPVFRLLPAPTGAWSRAARDHWWRRLVQFAPMRVLLGLIFLTPAAAILQSPQFGRIPTELAAAIALPAFLLALGAYARVVERRTAVELGRHWAFGELGAGIGLGALLLAATIGVLVAVGTYRISAGDGVRAIAGGVVFCATHALFEELLFRALLFKITEESLGSWAALVLQAAVFGAMHLGNPHATLMAGIAIAVEAGILLAAAYAVTRRIWLAWGVHWGWNLTQNSMFGVPSSGHPTPVSWLHCTPTGADAWTGGAFGVEASPVAVVLCLCAALPLLYVAQRRGRLVSRRSQRWTAEAP